MEIDSCTIPAHYTTSDDTHAMHKDFFFLSVYEEFKPEGPNTWKGTYGPYSVIVIQQNRYSDIKEN